MELDDFVIIIEAKDESAATTDNRVKWLTGIRYNITLCDNFQDHAQFRDWCIEYCSNKVVFLERENWGGDIINIVYFYNKEDAVLAKLKWVDGD